MFNGLKNILIYVCYFHLMYITGLDKNIYYYINYYFKAQNLFFANFSKIKELSIFLK